MKLISKEIYEQTFQNVIVGIPAIPTELHTELIKMASIPDGERFLNWLVNDGDKVKHGEVIGKYNVRPISFQNRRLKATIKAPCDGRIFRINQIEHTIWDWQTTGETYNTDGVHKTINRKFSDGRNRITDSQIQFYIQPEVKIFNEDRHIEDAEIHFTSRSLDNISEYAYVANTSTGLGRLTRGIKGFKTVGDRFWRMFSDDVIAPVEELKSS